MVNENTLILCAAPSRFSRSVLLRKVFIMNRQLSCQILIMLSTVNAMLKLWNKGVYRKDKELKNFMTLYLATFCRISFYRIYVRQYFSSYLHSWCSQYDSELISVCRGKYVVYSASQLKCTTVCTQNCLAKRWGGNSRQSLFVLIFLLCKAVPLLGNFILSFFSPVQQVLLTTSPDPNQNLRSLIISGVVILNFQGN